MLSRADPRIKLIWFIVLCFSTVLSPGPYVHIAFLLVPPIAFFGGVHRFAPWLALFAMPMLLFLLGLASFLADPASTLWGAALIVLRWSAVIYGALFFAAATQSHEIHFLIRWTRLHTGFGIALFYAIRTVPTAIEQLQGLVRTMQTRGLLPISWSWRVSGSILKVLPKLLLTLLISGARRTDQMWAALELRGGWSRAPVFFTTSKDWLPNLMLLGHVVMVVATVVIGAKGWL